MGTKALVTGAGGFIGHHLVTALVGRGYDVRGVDIKYPEFQSTLASEFMLLDLRDYNYCLTATKGVDQVYNLAADMGGIGYITSKLADIARNNVLINSNMLESSRVNKIDMFFYSSSACIYPTEVQNSATSKSLKESDAYPASPEEGYGWEKLFSEKLCEYYTRDFGLKTRVARFHNVYGPLGTYDGGKEKAPAALCRKIAEAAEGAEIEVWGDGEQTRSFMYIDDCIEGIFRIVNSNVNEPLNLGMDNLVTINGMVDIITKISGKTLLKIHDLSKPQGVRGRNSDNTNIKQLLGWSPSYPLEKGLSKTYTWISSQIKS